MLVKYIRHPHNRHRLVGCVVAIDVDKVGWSQCNPLDKFDKAMALRIAQGRAEKGTNIHPKPYYTYRPDGSRAPIDVIGEEILFMLERANRYFKVAVPV